MDSFTTYPALGEMDVLRLVQSLPGVAITSDFSSMLYVRGSPPDQTQINFDDVPILNPYHLGNAFSMFNADGVRKVEFSPGINSAQFGGYLGGRVNIVPKTGADTDFYNAKASIGLLSSKLSFGGKLGSLEYFFAGRRNYFDLVWIAAGDDPPYYFYDLQGSLYFPIGDNQSLSLQTFYSQDVLSDVLDHDEEGISGLTQPRWGNRIISLKYQYSINENTSINSHIYHSSGVLYTNTIHNDVDNEIKDVACRINLTKKAKRHYFQVGLELNNLLYSYDWYFDPEGSGLSNLVRPPQSVFFDNAPPDYEYKKDGWQSSFYIQDAYNVNILTSIIAGIRATWFDMGDKFNAAPRIQLKRYLSENLELSATYAQHFQWIYTLKDLQTASFFAPFTAYFPISKEEEPLFSRYLSCGLDYKLPIQVILKVEGYYKWLYNIPTFSDEYFSKQITQDQTASGIDIFLQRPVRTGFYMAANYSLSYVKVHKDEGNYPASYDRRHNIKFTGAYRWSNGWNIEIAGYFLSGLPYTPTVGKYPDASVLEPTDELCILLRYRAGYGSWNFVKGDKNSMRFPPYHRLDVGISKAWNYKKSRLTFKFQVLNVYNRKNPLLYVYEDEDTTQPKIEEHFNFPIVPSIQLDFEF